MIYFILPALLPLAGRMHGWGGFKGCKLLAKFILGGAYASGVMYVTGDPVHALLAGVVAALAFSMPHRAALLGEHTLFFLKGVGVSVLAAYFMSSPILMVITALGWYLSYDLPQDTVGYGRAQAGRFWAPRIWTWWGEVGSTTIAGVALIVTMVIKGSM